MLPFESANLGNEVPDCELADCEELQLDWEELEDDDEHDEVELELDCEELDDEDEGDVLPLDDNELQELLLDALFVLELELVLKANCAVVIISNAEIIMDYIVSILASDRNDPQAATLD